MTKPLREKSQGNILVYFALAITMIFAFVALAVDVGAAYKMSNRQVETLELAKEDCQASLNFLKFTNTPDVDTAKKVAQTLKANGFVGDATIYYFEKSSAQTGQMERHAGIGVYVNQQSATTFARILNVNSLPVGNNIVWTSKPYSSTQVWRPSGSHNSKIVFSITKGGYSQKSKTTISNVNQLPSAMRDALNAM